jgi:hypothetical protein
LHVEINRYGVRTGLRRWELAAATGQGRREKEEAWVDPVQIGSDKGRGAGDRGCAVKNTTSAAEKQTPWSGVEEREQRVYVAHSPGMLAGPCTLKTRADLDGYAPVHLGYPGRLADLTLALEI